MCPPQHTHTECPSISAAHRTGIHHTLDGGAHHNVTFSLDETGVCSADLMDWPMAGKCWLMPQITSPSPILSDFRWHPPPLRHGSPAFTAVCAPESSILCKLAYASRGKRAKNTLLRHFSFQKIFCVCGVVSTVAHGDYAFKRKLLTA